MSAISPPPVRERLNIVKGSDGSMYAEIPRPLDRWFNSIRDFTTSPIQIPTYTTATKPSASQYGGCVIYVSDGGAGAVFQGSNGASWVNLG